MKTTTQPHNHKSILLLFSLFILACVSMNAKAQYYQHTYDSPLVNCNGSNVHVHVTCNDGLVNRTTTSGTTLIGSANSLCFQKVNMVRAFNNGNMKFHYGFELSDNIGSPKHWAVGNSIAELSNGSGYAITGYVQNNPTTGSTVPGGSDILFMLIDTLGTPTLIKRYDLGNFDEGLQIIESQITPGEFYICGYRKITNFNPNSYAVVMKLDAAGNILWEKNYDFSLGLFNTYLNRAHSITESVATNELWIVGRTRHYLGGLAPYKGLMFSVDPATGALNPLRRWFMGYNAYSQWFNTVKTLANGEILVGGTFMPATPQNLNYDFLLFKYDPTLNNIVWQYTYPVPGTVAIPYPNDECFEVVERLNPNQLNTPEYYAVGKTDGGQNGGNDMIVLKVDNMGIPKGNAPAPAQWFHYGTTQLQNGISLDLINNNAAGDGITAFGTYQTPTNYITMYAVKAYFNGASPCNTQTVNSTYQNVAQPIDQISDNVTSTGPDYSPVYTTTSYTELNLCYAPTVGWGNNNKKENVGINEVNTETSFSLYPNPIVDGNFTLEYYSKQEGAIQITLLDALGRLAYSIRQQVSYNKNVLNIELPNSLTKGLYFVTIKQGEVNESIKIAIQ